jgi:8-oxo-dGTP pyrophosphatase MutT (NUDIX family)
MRSKTKRLSPIARAKQRILQVAALPWRKRHGRIEILLVTSRETRRWVIPKGGVMAHLVDMNAARQEAFEEAGIAGRMRRKPIGNYTYRKRAGESSGRLCAVKVFALEVRRELRNWPERSQRERRWFTIEQVLQRVGERELRRIIRACVSAKTGALAL